LRTSGIVKLTRKPPVSIGPKRQAAASPKRAASRSHTLARPTPVPVVGLAFFADLAIVFNGQHQPALFLTRTNSKGDDMLRLGHAIFDDVLDDRLQKESGQANVAKRLRNIGLDLQAAGKTRFLDVEIEHLKTDLLVQGHVGRGVHRQGGAEEVGQAQDHPLGLLFPPGHDQRRKRIQRVEQEVRIDLVTQGPQLGDCAARSASEARRSAVRSCVPALIAM
jgi:hypothetical protein